MSRVHDALRKAAQQNPETPRAPSRVSPSSARIETPPPPPAPEPIQTATAVLTPDAELDELDLILESVSSVPYNPLPEALLVNPDQPREAPAEEFRSLRTRLNHLQTLQPLHTLVVTSASPGEGKSFTAMNLAISQAQLADKRVLLADFDFRRPSIDKTFQIAPSPGITDYLRGKASLSEAIRKISNSNLFVMTAGETVGNPLELLNLRECKALILSLRDHFDWVILDSPPLLFAADGNLLSTMCDGTILVVRIGATTFDSVTRAMQSLCENNVLGTVVNGARRGELYSKYSYYHNYYYAPETAKSEDGEAVAEDAEEPQPVED